MHLHVNPWMVIAHFVFCLKRTHFFGHDGAAAVLMRSRFRSLPRHTVLIPESLGTVTFVGKFLHSDYNVPWLFFHLDYFLLVDHLCDHLLGRLLLLLVLMQWCGLTIFFVNTPMPLESEPIGKCGRTDVTLERF